MNVSGAATRLLVASVRTRAVPDGDGAELLRQHITSYWQARGFLGVRVERFQMPGRIDWGVRSNLVDGIPPTRGRAA